MPRKVTMADIAPLQFEETFVFISFPKKITPSQQHLTDSFYLPCVVLFLLITETFT